MTLLPIVNLGGVPLCISWPHPPSPLVLHFFPSASRECGTTTSISASEYYPSVHRRGIEYLEIIMAPLRYPLLFLSSAFFILAQSTTVQFIYPGPLTNPEPKANTFPILTVGNVVQITWTDSEVVDLIINQRNSPSTQIDRTPNSGE